MHGWDKIYNILIRERGGNARFRCEDDIKLDLKKAGCDNVNWIQMAGIRGRLL
jgi:hypothetical protein